MSGGGEPQSLILKGLAVDWSLPSKAALQDWLGFETTEGVRVREVVELLPEEVFTELDTLRRNFDRGAEKFIVRAYTLKILPLEDLPRFKELIERTRRQLAELDVLIGKAVETVYHDKARSYFEKTADRSPKEIPKIAGRFSVLMMPLRLDPRLWDEFLNDEMAERMRAAEEGFNQKKRRFDAELEGVRADLARTKNELDEAGKQLDTVTEGTTLPYDVATMRLQKRELESKIRDLKAQERDAQIRLDRLQRERSQDGQRFQDAARWAQRETQETERVIQFDVRRLWEQTLQELARKAVDALELEGGKKNVPLRAVQARATETLERIRSVQPTSMFSVQYERLIAAITDALEGKLEQAKATLEGLSA